MKIRVSTIFLLLLYIIVIGCENCFYLINAEKINVAGVINYKDIFIFLAGMFFVAVFLYYHDRPIPRFEFAWLIIGVIILSLTSSFQSQFLYGQSLVMGLRPQRFWIVWGLLYFPLRKLLYNHIIDVDDLIKLIFVVGTVEIILYSLQYFVGSGHRFLYVMANKRYGSDRYYFYNTILRILLFLNLDRVFNRKKIGRSVVYVILVLFVIMVVGKMRMTSLATMLTVALGIFLWRKGGKTKFVILLGAGVAAIVVFNMSIVQDAIIEIGAVLDGKLLAHSSLSIREAGRELYLQTLREHPVLGGGFISTLWSASSTAAGFGRNIYLVDNGLWGFVFIYGLPGAIWVIVMFYTLLRNGWKIVRNNNVFFMLLAPLGWLIAGQTEAHWFWDNGFICVTLLLVIMEEYLHCPSEKVSEILENKGGVA